MNWQAQRWTLGKHLRIKDHRKKERHFSNYEIWMKMSNRFEQQERPGFMIHRKPQTLKSLENIVETIFGTVCSHGREQHSVLECKDIRLGPLQWARYVRRTSKGVFRSQLNNRYGFKDCSFLSLRKSAHIFGLFAVLISPATSMADCLSSWFSAMRYLFKNGNVGKLPAILQFGTQKRFGSVYRLLSNVECIRDIYMLLSFYKSSCIKTVNSTNSNVTKTPHGMWSQVFSKWYSDCHHFFLTYEETKNGHVSWIGNQLMTRNISFKGIPSHNLQKIIYAHSIEMFL